MKENCECEYCKQGINEFFCSTCLYNFNRCQSKAIYDGMSFCPKCRPQELSESDVNELNNKIRELMNKIPPIFHLYEELPEPVFQEMREKELSGNTGKFNYSEKSNTSPEIPDDSKDKNVW